MIVLGIHHGHHASCALVQDGTLIAAVEQERITRRKHDGQDGLSNRLPVAACLAAAGLAIGQVDLIVSSFQSAGPGGVGFHRKLVEDGFDIFDPTDRRHWVVSHHLAHAACAIGCSGLDHSAALVCDLGGSTTLTGEDFYLPMSDFRSLIESGLNSVAVRTEALSVYKVIGRRFDLIKREYVVPHSSPDIFVHSPASLYDNISRAVFRAENCHGQLMALASLDVEGTGQICSEDIVNVNDHSHFVEFKNDWQNRVSIGREPRENAGLAHATQAAFERSILGYAKVARALTGCSKLVASGGAFLNIPANTRIAESGLFEQFFVPSAPHDAGISIGCAFFGFWETGGPTVAPAVRADDRLGRKYGRQDRILAIEKRYERLNVREGVDAQEVASILAAGGIVARHCGRSEFGPRALGSRSLLASPILAASKERLNRIKGRQQWRPIAPVVRKDALPDYFVGPLDSPYMNFVHQVRDPFQAVLCALRHPDGSTRAQTLTELEDPALFALLSEFGRQTGYPILCNTSLNGAGQPIVETPEQAISFLEQNADVNALILEDLFIERRPLTTRLPTRPLPDSVVSFVYPRGGGRLIYITRGHVSLEISEQTLKHVESGVPVSRGDLDSDTAEQLARAWHSGLVSWSI